MCAGTADFAIAAVTGRAARVVGVGFAPAMLVPGQGNVRTGHLDDRIALLRGDAARLPLGGASVDS